MFAHARCLILLAALATAATQAAVRTSNASGNWNVGATWVGGVAPAAGDDAIIAAGHTVTLTAAATITNLTINATGVLANGANTLGISGNYTNNGTHSGTGAVTMTGVGRTIDGAGTISHTGTFTLNTGAKTVLATANLTFAGTLAIVSGIIITNNGAVTITSAGGMTGSVGGSTWVNAANSTLANRGALLATGTLTASANPNTVTYNSTTAAQTVKGATYYNLDINKTAQTATLGAATTITNLTVTSGIFNSAGLNLTVTGTTDISGEVRDSATAGTSTYGDIIVNAGGIWNYTVAETPTINGSITNNGTFTSNTGVYTLAGAGKTLGGTNTLSISSATISGTYTNNGTFTVGTALAGAGGLTQGANATLNIGGTSTITTLTATASPNTVNYSGAAQTIKATTYHHLTLSGSGAKTAGGALTVNGDFTYSGTATFAAGTSLTHTFAGNWVVNTTAATPFSFTTTSTLNFNTPAVAAATSLSGSSAATLAFNAVNINNTSGFSTSLNFSASGNVTVAASVVFTPGATKLISGTGTLTGSGTVQVTKTTATADFASQYTITNKTLTNLTVDYAAAGQVLTNLTYGGLTVSGSITGASNTATVNNAFTVTGTFTPTSGTITMATTGWSIVNPGTLTFQALTISETPTTQPSASFPIAGMLTVNAAKTLAPSAGTITMTGTGWGITNNNVLTFNNLTIAGTPATQTSASFSVGGTLTVNGATTFAPTAGTVTFNNGASIANSGTLTFKSVTVADAATVSSTGNFAVDTTMTVGPSAAATFTPSAAGVISGGTGTLTGNGTVKVTRTAVTADFSSQYTINTATLTNLTVEYAGGSAQTVSALTYGGLTINNANGVTLAGNATVNATLTLTSGNITTNANVVIIGASGSVARTSGHVAGNLRKTIGTGGPVAATFEVGAGSNYTPVDLSFASVSVSGTLTIKSTDGDHSNIGTSTVNAARSVNRYWTLTNVGITFTNFDVTFTFVAGDLDGGTSTGSLVIDRYNGTSWSTTTTGTRTATTTQATGVTGVGDFQVAERVTNAKTSSQFLDFFP